MPVCLRRDNQQCIFALLNINEFGDAILCEKDFEKENRM